VSSRPSLSCIPVLTQCHDPLPNQLKQASAIAHATLGTHMLKHSKGHEMLGRYLRSIQQPKAAHACRAAEPATAQLKSDQSAPYLQLLPQLHGGERVEALCRQRLLHVHCLTNQRLRHLTRVCTEFAVSSRPTALPHLQGVICGAVRITKCHHECQRLAGGNALSSQHTLSPLCTSA